MTWTDNLTQDKRDKLMALTEHGAEHLRHADGDQGYAGFLLIADMIFRRKSGLSIFDLADFAWRDAYDDGLAPAEALRDALAAEGI